MGKNNLFQNSTVYSVCGKAVPLGRLGNVTVQLTPVHCTYRGQIRLLGYACAIYAEINDVRESVCNVKRKGGGSKYPSNDWEGRGG